jgi:hypothetical protein
MQHVEVLRNKAVELHFRETTVDWGDVEKVVLAYFGYGFDVFLDEGVLDVFLLLAS